MRLAEARAFTFDLDGTLVRRTPSGATPMPGATELLAAIRHSGRPLVVFTNASHVAPAQLAASASAVGLQLAEHEVLTPVCSALGFLSARHSGARVFALATEDTRARLAASGVALLEDRDAARAEVVLVAHVNEIELGTLEAAAHAVLRGASFLTGNYARAYAGANGPILSRGAMVTAAIAKASARRPTVVGKPSHAAVRKLSERLGVPAREVVVVGDDLAMDIALGKLGGSQTVLVRSGISDGRLDNVPARRRPDLVLDSVGDLLRLV